MARPTATTAWCSGVHTIYFKCLSIVEMGDEAGVERTLEMQNVLADVETFDHGDQTLESGET